MKSRSRFPVLSFPLVLVLPVALSIVLATFQSVHAQAKPGLVFRPGEHGSFSFDTGQLRGQLRSEEFAFGLHNLEDVKSGKRLTGRHGLLNVYRVFSDGKRYGVAGWEWESHAKVLDDGAVMIEAAAEPTRPFLLRGIYRLSGPATIDLEIQVVPRQKLRQFEVFLASYFDAAFSRCDMNVQQSAGQKGTGQKGTGQKGTEEKGAGHFMPAGKELGTWLMFPRDRKAVEVIQDGRWKLLPHPVEWEVLRPYQHPLVRRSERDGTLAALLLAPAAECFAVSMPYETESHYSVYFSLFGRDLTAGSMVSTRMRLQILSGPDDAQTLAAYQTFQKDLILREHSEDAR